MNFEILSTVKEVVNDVKVLNEKHVLLAAKKELENLKDQVDISYPKKVLDILHANNQITDAEYTQWSSDLTTTEKKQEVINRLSENVTHLAENFDSGNKEEKEKVRRITEELKKSKEDLAGLKNAVAEKSKEETAVIEGDAVKKIEETLDQHWYTKWMKGSYISYLKHKLHPSDTKETFMEKIRDWFFEIFGTLFVGKEVSSLVDALKGKNIATITETIKDKTKAVIEKIAPAEMVNRERDFENYVRVFVKTHFNKDLDAGTIKRVMSHMDMKKITGDATPEMQNLFNFMKTLGKENKDANVAIALTETVSLPFQIAWELGKALEAEGVITYSGLAFRTVGNILEYGFSGFKLFGAGIGVALGRISLDDLGGKISSIYDKSPDAAKTLLWAIMYRTHQSPIFKGLVGIAEMTTKMALWPLIEAEGDIKSLSHVIDGYKGNIDTVIKELEKFTNVLPAGEGAFIKTTIDEFKNTVGSLKESNELFKIAQQVGSKEFSLQRVKEMYVKTCGGESGFMKAIPEAQLNYDTFISRLRSKTASIAEPLQIKLTGADVFKHANMAWSKVKSTVMMKPNELTVMEEGLQRVQRASASFSDVMHQTGWFKSIKETMKGVKMGFRNMSESLPTGVATFEFQSVTESQQFVDKLKFLSKKSPEAVKFILGKAPIFIIAGMALSKDGPLEAKTQNLFKDMKALLPLFGPGLLIVDAAQVGNLLDKDNMGQVGLGCALFVGDVWTIRRHASKGEIQKIVKYMAQPVVDLRDISKFILQSGKNVSILGRDFLSLAKVEGGMLEATGGIFKTILSWRNFARVGSLAALAVGGYVTREYLMGSSDIDDATKKQLALYKNNPEQLDRDLAKNWPTMKQEERNNYIKVAVSRQPGMGGGDIPAIDVSYDSNKHLYSIQLPRVIRHKEAQQIKDAISEAVQNFDKQDQVDVMMSGGALTAFRKELAGQFAGVAENDRKAGMIAYVRAMGYDHPENIIG